MFPIDKDDDIPGYTVVDGHHRLVRRFRGGVRQMDFYACMPSLWRQILMPSSPEEDAVVAKTLPDRPENPTNIIHEVTMRRG
jgi:hypothetical protein